MKNTERKTTTVKNVLEELLGTKEEKKEVKTMKQHKMTLRKDGTPRFSEHAYIYGQLFRGYVESDMSDKFTIENVNVRKDSWKEYLFALVKNKYIRAFKVGKTIETAARLTIYGFDGERLLYEEYCKKIIKNMQKELAEQEKEIA